VDGFTICLDVTDEGSAWRLQPLLRREGRQLSQVAEPLPVNTRPSRRDVYGGAHPGAGPRLCGAL
jgi:hypothetical protein